MNVTEEVSASDLYYRDDENLPDGIERIWRVVEFTEELDDGQARYFADDEAGFLRELRSEFPGPAPAAVRVITKSFEFTKTEAEKEAERKANENKEIGRGFILNSVNRTCFVLLSEPYLPPMPNANGPGEAYGKENMHPPDEMLLAARKVGRIALGSSTLDQIRMWFKGERYYYNPSALLERGFMIEYPTEDKEAEKDLRGRRRYRWERDPGADGVKAAAWLVHAPELAEKRLKGRRRQSDKPRAREPRTYPWELIWPFRRLVSDAVEDRIGRLTEVMVFTRPEGCKGSTIERMNSWIRMHEAIFGKLKYRKIKGWGEQVERSYEYIHLLDKLVNEPESNWTLRQHGWSRARQVEFRTWLKTEYNVLQKEKRKKRGNKDRATTAGREPGGAQSQAA